MLPPFQNLSFCISYCDVDWKENSVTAEYCLVFLLYNIIAYIFIFSKMSSWAGVCSTIVLSQEPGKIFYLLSLLKAHTRADIYTAALFSSASTACGYSLISIAACKRFLRLVFFYRLKVFSSDICVRLGETFWYKLLEDDWKLLEFILYVYCKKKNKYIML